MLAIAVQPDNKILIGGAFTMTNSTTRNRIARLNADGSLDTGFDPGAGGASNEVDAIALQPNGKIVIGGKFTTVGGTGRSRIARLNANGSNETWFDPGDGASYYGVRGDAAAGRQSADRRRVPRASAASNATASRGRRGDRFVFLPLILR